MRLVWRKRGFGVAHFGGQRVQVSVKPTLSVDYDALDADFDPNPNVGTYTLDGVGSSLLAKDMKVIKAYLQGVQAIFDVVTPAPGVDADGFFIGDVASTDPRAVSSYPPNPKGWRWNGLEWEEDEPLEALRANALLLIDEAAGAARTRYITSVPGQEGTYIAKALEAEVWLRDTTQPAGAFLQAEAVATATDLLTCATQIMATRQVWLTQLGPAIELERRRAKLAVQASATRRDVRTLLAGALAALKEI